MKRERVIIVLAVCFMLLALSSWGFAQIKAPEQPKAPDTDQTWKLYLESQAKKYYFSPASLRILDKRKVRVWEKIAERTNDGEADVLKSLIELDCSSSKYRVVATKEVDRATGADKPEMISENEPWQYFSLESILGVLYENVCYQGGAKIQDTTSKPVKPKKEEKKKEDKK